MASHSVDQQQVACFDLGDTPLKHVSDFLLLLFSYFQIISYFLLYLKLNEFFLLMMMFHEQHLLPSDHLLLLFDV